MANKKFRFSARIVEKSMNLPRNGNVQFEFRNTGADTVTINGIPLLGGQIFQEFLLTGEESDGDYNIVFQNLVPPSQLTVVEKSPIGQ